jgi:hypothetical protein
MGNKIDINTHQYVRIRILDNLLATKKMTKEELISEVIQGMESELSNEYSYSPRTFDTDKKFIENELDNINEDENLEGDNRYQILKIRETRAGGPTTFYKYSHPNISVFDYKLDKNDIQNLMDAVGLIDQIKGFKWDFDVQLILKRLDQQIKFNSNKVGSKVVGLQNLVADGYQYLNDLYLSIIDKKVIAIKYEPFGDEVQNKIIHPYYIKQYNNRWFLLGFDETRGGISNFPLDRMKSKPEWLEILFKLPDNIFNPNEYFRDIIGVTNYADKPVEEVLLLFTKNSAPYIVSKKIHESQETIEIKEDGSVVIKLCVKQNFELKNYILGYGSAVTVLQPQTLRQEIKEQASEILSKYC